MKIPKFELKEPIQYLDKIKVGFDIREGWRTEETRYSLYLSNKLTELTFTKDENGWTYTSTVCVQINNKNVYIFFVHYYDKENNDEIIGITIHNDDTDIDFSISLKSGLAWQTHKEAQAKLATDEEVDIIITYLNKTIKKIRKDVICNMIV